MSLNYIIFDMESKCILYFSSRLRHDSIIYNKTAVFGKKFWLSAKGEQSWLFECRQIPQSLYVRGRRPGPVYRGLSAVFLRKSWRRCLELGISKEKLSAVARSSAVFTIVPSVSIVIGLFTLSTVLGIPWPWYRLSVVGSVSYELMAADMVADGMGYGSVGEMAAQADHTVFGAVMFVMSICILAGIIINIFAVEKIQTGMSTLKKKAGRLGHHRQLLLLPGDRGRLHAADLRLRNSLRPDLPHQHGSGGPVRFVHEALSSQVAGSFIMSISLIVSMAASVLLEQIF